MAGDWDKFVYGPSKDEQLPDSGASDWSSFVTPPAAPKAGLTSSQISSSIDQYQAGLYGVGEAVAGAVGAEGSAEWLKKQREENETLADKAAQRARDLGAVDSWENVHGIGDFGSYAKGLAIQSLPYAAEAIAGGALARGAMSGTRAALTAATAAKDVEGAATASRALTRGSLAGATAASYPSSVGDILQNQREQSGGKTDLGAASLLGVPYAALNALGETGALAKGVLPKNPLNILDSVSGFKGGVARAGAALIKTGAEEAVGETGQEVVNQMGRMAVDPNATLTDPEALARYKESAIGGFALGGLMGGATGWRRNSAEGNDISQAMGSKDAAQPSVTTQQFQAPVAPAPAMREQITEDGEIIQVPVAQTQQAPAVAGGSTDIAQAQQQAQQQAAQQQAQAQQAQAADQAAQQFGVVNPATPAVGSAFGQKVYGKNIPAVANAIATFTAKMPPQQVQLAQAITQANALTGGKLISFQFNANNVMASVEQGLKAIGKVATKLQIDQAETAEEAAAILNDQSTQLKGDKLEQVNAIHVAITGQNTTGYEAAQQPKGAKDDKLQLQNDAGLREVPVTGGATEAIAGGDGAVRPTQVQPIGAASVGAGPLNEQAGQPSTGGVRPSATTNVTANDGGSPTSNTQISEAPNAQTNQVTSEAAQGEVRAEGATTPDTGLQQASSPARSTEEVKSDTELLADQAEDITAEVMEILIPVHQRMTGNSPQERAETAKRLRDFTFSILMNGHYDTLAVMAKDFGIKLHQAKDWSAKALAFKADPEFNSKLKGAYEVAATKRGLTITELITRINAKANEEVNAKEEVDRSISTSKEQGGPRDSDERKLNLGFDAEGRDTGEVEANEGLAIKSRKSGESIQERFNAVDTNQAKVVRLMQDLANAETAVEKIEQQLESIKNAQTNTQEFSEARVAGAMAKYEAALVKGEPASRDALYVLAYDAMQKGNEGEASMYLEDLEKIHADKVELAAKLEAELKAKQTLAEEQAKKQTNKSADLNKPEKETKNAVQKRSAKEVPVQERTGGSETLGEGNAEGGKAAAETEAKVEPKQEEVKTPEEQWAALAEQAPGMPAYESLSKDEKARWDDLANRGVANLAAANKLFEIPKQEGAAQAPVPTGTTETLAPQVEKLTEGQTVRLEKHYGAKRDSTEFFSKLGQDVVLYASKGAEAVSAAIRDIVKAITEGVLAVALVVNPNLATNNLKLDLPQVIQQVEEVRATVPQSAKAEMSEAAQRTYELVAPIAKEGNRWFMITDKADGKLHVFDAKGDPVVQAPALTGRGVGDKVIGGNGVTPAGKFTLQIAQDPEYYSGYRYDLVESADATGVIAVHAVWNGTKSEKRSERLASKTAADNRISWGCINTTNEVFTEKLLPNWEHLNGSLMFVMPENAADLERMFPAKTSVTSKGASSAESAVQTRTVVGKEDQTPSNAPVQQAKTTQSSRRRRMKGEKYTPEGLKQDLLEFMNRNSLGKDTVVVDDIEDLRDLPEFAAMDDVDAFFDKEGIDFDTQAFVYKGKAYMLAGNIAMGTGRGVYMHEVGSHLGIQKGLSAEQVARLASRVTAWAKARDGSIESTLAAHAVSRMKNSGTVGTQARQQETIAYFIEAAVNAGINPTASNKIASAGLREWMRTMWAAFKNALRMVRGVDLDKVTAQDMVDLAYGYAQLSATRFHGSNSKFRKFLTKFMNSGAGGQQYGWGSYFAEARPTAEGYSVPEMDAPAGTRSHLYTVDLAITPDEMILWSKPMDQQSALVQAAAAKYPARGMERGMDFYKGTSERLYEEKYGVEPTTKAQRTEAEMMASQFMDSLGIKGIQYLDATTATRDTSNFVVFNEDNIIRVQTETGLAHDRQAMATDFTWERTQQSRADQPSGVFSKAGEWLDAAITSPKETLHKLKLGFLTLDQLAELDKSPGQVVRAYSDVMTAMQKTSKDLVYKAAQIDQLWAKLSQKDSDNVSQVMRDATRAKFDPSLGVAGKNQTEVDIANAYRALPSSAKDVYAKVKKYYEDAFATRLAIMEESAAKLGGKELKEIQELYSKLKGPYFPLGRTGRYYAVGMSPRVAELTAKKEDSGLSSSEATELAALRKQADQYKTSSFNTLYDAKKAAEEFKKSMGDSYYNEVEENIESAMSKMPNFAKLEESITTQLGGETRAEVKSMLAQLMFDSLPEHHALKNQMQREGIYGENEDMRQVFAQTSISQAHYISRLQFGGELNQAMLAVAKSARKDIEMRQIQNELKLRTKLSMDNTHSALTDAMVNASYFAHLGLSPAFLLTNMTQVPMITAPWLGARHGMGATKRAMAMALADTAKIIKSTYKDGDWRSELNWNNLFPAGSNEDRMFRDLLDRNVLDITMEHDLAAVASAQKGIFDDKISKATGGKLGGMSDVVKMVNTPVRITELANRAVTALSAYRMKMEALATAPMTPEERHTAAVNYAARAVSETQLNYSELNAPRHMRQVFGSKPLAKMIFQFRKYQQGMLYLIAKNISDALPGSNATAEDRRIARRTIAGLYATTGLMAGTTGMPLMGTVGLAGIANLIAAAFGDEDEPWDFETEYRNFLTDWLGKDMALLVAKGLPAYLGADLSQRIGMGDIANPIPFVQRGSTGQSTVANVLYAAGGAPIGMVGTMYDGIVAMANGDVMKGMEKVIPVKAVKDALRTYRYADEGMTDKRGNVILPPEKFDAWDLTLRGMGFAPTKESEYYAANAAMQNAKTAATDVRTRLLREYSEAKLKGEPTTEVDAKIADFNSRHPEKSVRIDMSTKLKAVQSRRKMAAERTESGLRVGKYEKPFASEARFATQE